MGFADRAAWWAMVIGVYAIVWFISFLMLLPVGLNYDDDPPGQFIPGAAPAVRAAPSLSMRAKILWSTAIAATVWLLLAGLVLEGVIKI